MKGYPCNLKVGNQYRLLGKVTYINIKEEYCLIAHADRTIRVSTKMLKNGNYRMNQVYYFIGEYKETGLNARIAVDCSELDLRLFRQVLAKRDMYMQRLNE